ncbi:MAG: ABC transporter ATP-binding protein [Gemmatimonadales bacterium]
MTPHDRDDTIVELVRVTRRFSLKPAVEAVSLTIRRGEFFSLLGPSGCGKSTTLRLLAGLERADEGDILIAGQRVNDRRPYERNLGMVFQSYALFPHLSVRRNVAFGLERHGVPRDQIEGRVTRALETVRLDAGEFSPRMPSELSGGQRQRVALARALVLEPDILLLDEPLGALDLKLRREMQLELKALNRDLGITFLYVTHDQEEALAMSDRIAIMDHARIAQVGTPVELYERPRTGFVATFLGEANLLGGVARRSGGVWRLERPSGSPIRLADDPALRDGGAVRVAIRPEWLGLVPASTPDSGTNVIAGTVDEVVYLGEMQRIRMVLDGGGTMTVALRARDETAWRRGDRGEVRWRPEDGRLLEDS